MVRLLKTHVMFFQMRLHDTLCGFRGDLGGFRTIAEIFASLWTFSVEEKAYPGGLPARWF